MHRRSLVSLLLSLSLAVAASACKPKGGASGSGKADDAEIVIGHYASMTGNTAHFGQDTDKAARLAVEQLNAAEEERFHQRIDQSMADWIDALTEQVELESRRPAAPAAKRKKPRRAKQQHARRRKR